MGLREDIIRELVTEYQQTHSGVVFSKILKRVDKLLLKTIHIHAKRRPHLLKVDLRDLYHSAIVGLGRAALTAKDNETGNKLIARIIAYVKCELNNNYPLNSIKRFCTFISFDGVSNFYTPKYREIQTLEAIETNAELSLFRDEYAGMLYHNYISVEDLLIVGMRYGQSMQYKEIAKVINTSEQNARERAIRILKKVQEWFKDFEI